MIKRKNQFYALLAFTIILSSAATEVFAKGPGGGRGGPPPEAIEACANLSEGDACSFEGRRGDVLEGQCFVPPRGDEVLMCKPSGAPEGRRGRPDMN